MLNFSQQIEIWLKRSQEERIELLTQGSKEVDRNPEITEVAESPEYYKAFGDEEINKR